MSHLSHDELDEVHPDIRPLVLAAWRTGDDVPDVVKNLEPEDVVIAADALGLNPVHSVHVGT